MNELINGKGVCKRAPATLGLLNTNIAIRERKTSIAG